MIWGCSQVEAECYLWLKFIIMFSVYVSRREEVYEVYELAC